VRAVALPLLATALLVAGCGADRHAAASRLPTVLALTAHGTGLTPQAATAFVAGDGRIVTVAHAVGGQGWLRVGGRGARVVRTDPRLDLAVLRVAGMDAPALRTAKAAAGQDVRILVLRDGAARSLPATVRRTITARVRDAPDARAQTRPALELDAAIAQGDSGAPVLDARDRVVGVVFAQSADGPDRAYAVDAAALRNLR
jgi:S1-C subfamily serine protease